MRSWGDRKRTVKRKLTRKKISSHSISPHTGIIGANVTLDTSIVSTSVTPMPRRSPTWKDMKKTPNESAAKMTDGMSAVYT